MIESVYCLHVTVGGGLFSPILAVNFYALILNTTIKINVTTCIIVSFFAAIYGSAVHYHLQWAHHL